MLHDAICDKRPTRSTMGAENDLIHPNLRSTPDYFQPQICIPELQMERGRWVKKYHLRRSCSSETWCRGRKRKFGTRSSHCTPIQLFYRKQVVTGHRSTELFASGSSIECLRGILSLCGSECPITTSTCVSQRKRFKSHALWTNETREETKKFQDSSRQIVHLTASGDEN